MNETELAHTVRTIFKAWALTLETVKYFLEIYHKKLVLRQTGSEMLSIIPYVTQGKKNIIPLNWG